MDATTLKEVLLDLSFINDREKKSLLNVIKKDMELNKESLSSLEIDIYDRKEDFKSNSRNESECFCHQVEYCTVFSKFLAPQCYQCDILLCENCDHYLKKSHLCRDCLREWVFNSQLPEIKVFYSDSFGIPSPLHGSKLIQISLQNTKDKTKTSRASSIETDSPKKSKSVSPSKDTTKDSSTSSYSFQKIPHITDADTGFTLIKEMKSEENLAEVSSLYSEPCDGEYEISGYIKFGLWYREDEGNLYVRIVEATDLGGKKVDKSKINPYVKINLLPGKSKHTKRKTTIQRGVTSATFNETHKYKISNEDLGKNAIWLSVWNWNDSGRHSFLGEVHCLPLSDMDLTNSKNMKVKLEDTVKNEDESTDNLYPNGRLFIALKFEHMSYEKLSRSCTPDFLQGETAGSQSDISSIPMEFSSNMEDSKVNTIGTLFVHVNEATDLLCTDLTGNTNPFVRSFLLPNTSLRGKRKTKVINGELNPVWNEVINYNYVTLEDLLTERVLELTVWDSDRRGENCFMGGIRLGPAAYLESEVEEEWMDSSEDEASHWNQMLSQPGEWVKWNHTLRSSMTSLKSVHSSPQSTDESFKEDGIKTVDIAEEEEKEDYEELQESTEDEGNERKILPKPMELTLNRRGKDPGYEISGEIEVGLDYNRKDLGVKIIRASNLAGVNKKGTKSNPFVKLYLLPDKNSKKKTRIEKKSQNPTFNETFNFPISMDELVETTLWITVWSYSKTWRNKFLGEICIPLDMFSDIHDPYLKIAPVTYMLQDYSSQTSVFNSSLARRKTTVYRINTRHQEKKDATITIYDSVLDLQADEEVNADDDSQNSSSLDKFSLDRSTHLYSTIPSIIVEDDKSLSPDDVEIHLMYEDKDKELAFMAETAETGADKSSSSVPSLSKTDADTNKTISTIYDDVISNGTDVQATISVKKSPSEVDTSRTVAEPPRLPTKTPRAQSKDHEESHLYSKVNKPSKTLTPIYQKDETVDPPGFASIEMEIGAITNERLI